MKLDNKKYLYANGSSISCGGGFEINNENKNIRKIYKEKSQAASSKLYNIPDTAIECSYPYLLSQKLGLECINHAKSGGGIDRMIRTTWEWIFQNKDKVEETIFLLEPQVGIRLDWWMESEKTYGIVNAHFDGWYNRIYTIVEDWFDDSREKKMRLRGKYQELINDYFKEFHNENEYLKLELQKLLFFVAYLNEQKIDYLISIPNTDHLDIQREILDIIPERNNLFPLLDYNGIFEYGQKMGLLIKDEINADDFHLSWMGNNTIADIIHRFLKQPKKSML